MKKFLLFFAVLLVTGVVVASESDIPNEDVLIAYSRGEASIEYATKTVNHHLDGNVTIYVGLDVNHELSEVSVTKNLSEEVFFLFKKALSGRDTCLTRCGRDNDCDDKNTSAGVIGCYASCAIDCAYDALVDAYESISELVR